MIVEGRVTDLEFIELREGPRLRIYLKSDSPTAYHILLRNGPAFAANHLLKQEDVIRVEGAVTYEQCACGCGAALHDLDMVKLHVKIRNDEWQAMDVGYTTS
jgi:hypothetical protein